jgi:hypothetical protein
MLLSMWGVQLSLGSDVDRDGVVDVDGEEDGDDGG